MKRRIFAVLLMVLMLSAISMPVAAMAIDVQPYGAASADGGLASAGGNKHYLYIYVSGSSEYKSGSSTLYRNNNGAWQRVTSISISGYSYELYNDVLLTLSSGSYMVTVSATTSNGTFSFPVYYNI